MDLDLRDDLDRCFGDGPPVDDSDQLLARGRRAVRRRRLAGTASVVAVVAAVAGATALAAGSATPSGRPPVAVTPSTTATSTAPETVSFTIVEWPRLTGSASDVQLTSSHQLRVRPGVEIDQLVIDPYEPAAYPASVGIAYRVDGRRHWVLCYALQDGTSTGSAFTITPPSGGPDDFEAWLAGQVHRPQPPAATLVVDAGLPADDPVTVDSTAGLHVAPDVRVLRIVTNPFGEVAPAASVAVVYARHGRTSWFVARVSDDGSSAGSTRRADPDVSFTDWVARFGEQHGSDATGGTR